MHSYFVPVSLHEFFDFYSVFGDRGGWTPDADYIVEDDLFASEVL